jgi:FkbM family methyltransferase
MPARARFGKSREPELGILADHVHPGGTAVDVGAHRGVYTYWLHRLVGADGTVLAFEPQPDLHDYLRAGLRPARYRNVVLSPVALSDHTGAERLVIPVVDGAPQIAWAGLDHAEADGVGVDVDVSTLDQQLEGRQVDFVKIDVEGHEGHVLAGATETLTARHAAWLVEIETRHAGASVARTLGMFRDTGYRAHYLAADRTLREVPDADLLPHRLNGVENGRYVNNFLFLAR